jgi:hypothetical protein
MVKEEIDTWVVRSFGAFSRSLILPTSIDARPVGLVSAKGKW